MKINRGCEADSRSTLAGDGFTGMVCKQPMLGVGQIRMNSTFFEPSARTHWHVHSDDQVLMVTSGRGWVRTAEDQGAEMLPGDIVYLPGGVPHWHGAAADCFVVHTSINIGSTEMLHEVSAEDYGVAR